MKTSIQSYLKEQLELHPSIMPRDMIKLCYQSAFGAEHLLSDLAAAKEYLRLEIDSVDDSGDALFEPVSADVCRVNLSSWKAKNLPADWLFNMFALTASVTINGDGCAIFARHIAEVTSMAQSGELPFSADEWRKFYDEYEQGGVRAVHHSDEYRETEKPAYRIVLSRFTRLFPILELIAKKAHAERAETAPQGDGSQETTTAVVSVSAETAPQGDGSQETTTLVVVSVDGRAASGKTTLAAELAKITGAGVVHMDDFFLPLDLRSDERFAEAGGNVHYERFLSEVMPFIRDEGAFAYRIFDCGELDFVGLRDVVPSRIRVIEGAYACHPKFGDYADVRVFSDVEPTEQMARIVSRDGDEMAEMFRSRWLPFEEHYIEACGIMEKADLII